jgi:hypothetical protein
MSDKKGLYKIITPILGTLFFIASIWYIHRAFTASWGKLFIEIFRTTPWHYFLGGSVLYAVGNLFFTFGWARLLQTIKPQIPLFSLVRDYSRVYLSRYLFGYWGLAAYRHLVFRKYGINHSILLIGAIIENVFLFVVIGILYSYSRLVFNYVFFNHDWVEFLFLGGVIIGGSFLFYYITYWIIRLSGNKYTNLLVGIPAIIQINLLYVCHFFIAGLILWILLNGNYPITKLTSNFSISWLIGMLTPGVVQGIGVREAVFVNFFKHDVPGILKVIITMRLISIGGDLLTYLLSWIPCPIMGKSAADPQ